MPATRYRGHWYVDVWVDVPGEGRRRIRRKSPAQTKKGTQAYERELIEAALSTSTPFVERRFDEYAVEFLENYAVVNNRLSEVEAKESRLRVHLIPYFGSMMLSEIGFAEIERYKAVKTKEGVHPKTLNNHLTVLRMSLVFAQKCGYLDEVPPFDWMETPLPEIDFLTFDELAKLVEARKDEWQSMVITAAHSGLRLGELLALRWDAIDFKNGRIIVRQAIAAGKIGPPKNGHSREVPLNETCAEALRERCGQLLGPYVFCDPDGSLMTRHRPREALYRRCDRAGIRRIGWHKLRHTFASHLVMIGVPLAAIQSYLGHSSIKMTLRYAHLSPDVERKYVRLLDEAGNYLGTESEGVAQLLEFKRRK